MDLASVFGGDPPALIELGLSADAAIADRVGELAGMRFLTSSDAHSLAMVGREHNLVRVRGSGYQGVFDALLGLHGEVVAHYGLDPRLGKYHRTVCARCGFHAGSQAPPVLACPSCGGRVVTGVLDRAAALPGVSDTPSRPPYVYQIPLEWLPGIGPVTRDRLVAEFADPWSVLHRIPLDRLETVAGHGPARRIGELRAGGVAAIAGGGGRYGRLMFPPASA